MLERDFGRIVRDEWLRTPATRSNVELDEFVIMPNHLHGIVIINDTSAGAIHESPLQQNDLKSQRRQMLFSKILGRFKMNSAKRINIARGTPGLPVWQRGVYDHIIRNEADLHRIQAYIRNNPPRWVLDEEHAEYQA